MISAIFLLSSTCNSSRPDKRQQEYSSLDSIWMPFVKAMESNDIEFLIENSLDSLTCYAPRWRERWSLSPDFSGSKCSLVTITFSSIFIDQNH
jgi:hypothetical protein